MLCNAKLTKRREEKNQLTTDLRWLIGKRPDRTTEILPKVVTRDAAGFARHLKIEISCVDNKRLCKVVPRAFMDYVQRLKNPLTKCSSLWNILDRQEINWAWRWLSFPKQPYKVRVVATIEMATRHSTTRSLLLTRWTPLWSSHLKDDKNQHSFKAEY